MNFLDLFSGIGGFAYGAHLAALIFHQIKVIEPSLTACEQGSAQP